MEEEDRENSEEKEDETFLNAVAEYDYQAKFQSTRSNVSKGINSFSSKMGQAWKAVVDWLDGLKKPDFEELTRVIRKALKKLGAFFKRVYHQTFKPKPRLRGGFVLDWNTVFGWWGDPFQEKVLEPIEKFYIDDIKIRNAINLFILKTHRFGTIVGEDGTGKTTLLRWMEKELGDHKDKLALCYIENPKKLHGKNFIKEIIRPVTGAYQRVFKRPHEELDKDSLVKYLRHNLKGKALVILIDKVENLGRAQIETLSNLVSSKLAVQVVITGDSHAVKMSEIGGYEKDMLKISLKDMPYDKVEKVILRRIHFFGGDKLFPFTEAALTALHKRAGGNPKKLLALCHEKAMQLSINHRNKLIKLRQEMERKKKEEEAKLRDLEKKRREEEEMKWEERRKKAREERATGSSILGMLSKEREAKEEKEEEITEEELEEEYEKQPSSPTDEIALKKLDEAISLQLTGAERKDKRQIKKEEKSELERNEELFSDLFEGGSGKRRKSTKALSEADAIVAELIQEERRHRSKTRPAPTVKKKTVKKGPVKKKTVKKPVKKTVTKKKPVKKKIVKKKTKKR